MTILLDDDPQPQERSRNEQIRALAIGIPVIYGNLPVDGVFYAYGEGRAPTMVGAEVKRADDMARSIGTGRLVQQFRAASEYGCTAIYLFIQGIIRPSRVDGLVEKNIGQGRWVATDPPVEYNRWTRTINTYRESGIRVIRTSDPYETAAEFVNLYHWWQTPPEEHTSMERFYQPVHLAKDVPLFRKLVKELPGVGWQRSMDAFLEFKDQGLSIRDVFNMDEKGWKRVKGIGTGIARNIVGELNAEIKIRDYGD